MKRPRILTALLLVPLVVTLWSLPSKAASSEVAIVTYPKTMQLDTTYNFNFTYHNASGRDITQSQCKIYSNRTNRPQSSPIVQITTAAGTINNIPFSVGGYKGGSNFWTLTFSPAVVVPNGSTMTVNTYAKISTDSLPYDGVNVYAECEEAGSFPLKSVTAGILIVGVNPTATPAPTYTPVPSSKSVGKNPTPTPTPSKKNSSQPSSKTTPVPTQAEVTETPPTPTPTVPPAERHLLPAKYFRENAKTTLLESLPSLAKVPQFTLDIPTLNRITYVSEIDLTGLDPKQIETVIKIDTPKVVSVDTEKFPKLDKPAIVTMYNLPFKSMPTILRNGKEAEEYVTEQNYDIATGTLTFKVKGFSTYEAVESRESTKIAAITRGEQEQPLPYALIALVGLLIVGSGFVMIRKREWLSHLHVPHISLPQVGLPHFAIPIPLRHKEAETQLEEPEVKQEEKRVEPVTDGISPSEEKNTFFPTTD